MSNQTEEKKELGPRVVWITSMSKNRLAHAAINTSKSATIPVLDYGTLCGRDWSDLSLDTILDDKTKAFWPVCDECLVIVAEKKFGVS